MRKLKLLLLAAVFVAVPLAQRGDAVQWRPTHTVEHTVMPGDTLWDLAARIPGVDDRREAVHKLVELNGLDGGPLLVGQVVRLPAQETRPATG